jgi:hypothetical protein
MVTEPTPPANLPAQPTPLIGRAHASAVDGPHPLTGRSAVSPRKNWVRAMKTSGKRSA